jgi:hypothetical protein
MSESIDQRIEDLRYCLDEIKSMTEGTPKAPFLEINRLVHAAERVVYDLDQELKGNPQ